MRTTRLVIVLLAFTAFFSASAAFAAAPPTTPAVVQNITFETNSPSDNLPVDTSFNPHGTAPGAAYWGVITGEHHGGTHALWCAGNGGAFPSYPAGTHGTAYLAVVDSSAWETSTVTFSYIEPTFRAGDLPINPFVVSWAPASGAATASSGGLDYDNTRLPTTSQWTTISIPRGQLLDGGMISKAAGWLRFQFVSDPLGGGSGEGASVDDIQVTGYEFGAVNNLVARRVHGNLTNVNVQWDAPWAVGTTSTPDPRTIYYRVWRHDVKADTWTELTSSRQTSLTFTDTNAPVDGTYEYAVQGWESSGDTAWGRLATSLQVGPAQVGFASGSLSQSSVAYSATTTYTASLVDETSAPLAGAAGSIVLQRSIAGGAWTTLSAAVTEISPGTYAAPVRGSANANFRLRYQPNSAVSPTVHLSVGTYLTIPSAPSKAKRNKSFTVSGQVSGVPGISRSVTLRAYHKETKKVHGKKTTVWVVRVTAVVKVSASESIVSYKKSLKLTLAGSYRITAAVSDAYSAAMTSAPRTLTVK
jgi:hypothetical protein